MVETKNPIFTRVAWLFVFIAVILSYMIVQAMYAPSSSYTTILELGIEKELTLEGLEPINVTITGFVNSPCPTNAQCLWEGQAIILKYELHDFAQEEMNLFKFEGYQLDVIKTDYVSYAKVRVSS